MTSGVISYIEGRGDLKKRIEIWWVCGISVFLQKIRLMTERNNTLSSNHEAVLSSADGFTAFSYGGYNIRFRAPYSLERYVDVLRWDDGYLVVLAKYRHNAEPEEEYIDLKPILEGLYIDSASFLKPIKSVRIAYA